MSKILLFIMFFLIANPMTYNLTSQLPVVGDMITDASGKPTQAGVLIHALVFVLLMHFAYGAMKK
jgi:hypothetical protein